MDDFLSTLAKYEEQLSADPAAADYNLLIKGKRCLEQYTKTNLLNSAVTHRGIDLLWKYLRDFESALSLLDLYLENDLAPEEEAWARWHKIDCLALLRSHEASIVSQLDFYHWAKKTMPKDYLLVVLYDGTQSMSWLSLGKVDEWLHLFEEVMQVVTPSDNNRLNRFFLLRTAGRLLLSCDRSNDVLSIINRIWGLCNEDPTWEQNLRIHIENLCLLIDTNKKTDNIALIRRLANDAISLLQNVQNRDSLSMRSMFHNLASSLFFSQQYDMAIPLFREAIKLGITSPHTYGWLAASVWKTTGNREEVLTLLSQASCLQETIWDKYKSLPEFSDIKDDPAFGCLRHKVLHVSEN